ncbi:MAG TPA: 3'-5' exonuclease, partial [Methylophilaceae bacterium]|nr:3'-5' exonuclease [Methylophilaceae bacterium]
MIDEKSFPPRMLAGLISSAKNELVSPAAYGQLGSGPAHRAAEQVYPVYEKILRDNVALDFDDLIGKTVHLLEKNKEIRDKWRQLFKYVMIDEYQDTNAAQYKLVKLLTNPNPPPPVHVDATQGAGEKRKEGVHKSTLTAPRSQQHGVAPQTPAESSASADEQAGVVQGSGANIAVVGDDWQSIYSWRGADFRNILNFEKDYPKCTVIKLEQNYRSTKAILDSAHAVITKNLQRSEKKLWTAKGAGLPVQLLQVGSERAEGESIVRRIRNSVDTGRIYQHFAVLYRTNAQSRSIEEAFIHYGIPYRIIGGQRFYDRKEIKDIMAYMRLIYQPQDQISFERIVNVPARGVGAKSLQNFLSWKTSQGLTLQDALDGVEECADITPKAR